MPYISETALRSVKLNREILPPQHIVVNPFSGFPTACQPFVHKPSMAHPPALCKTGKCSVDFLWRFWNL